MSTTYQDLTYTTFPDTIQSFVEMEDITSGDASALDAYQTAMRAGDFQAARQALASMTNANNKIIDATKINTLNDTLIALERFYKTDIEPYVTQKQAEWQAIVDLFVDNFAYIGEWNSTTGYKRNNIVSRTENPAEDIYLYIAMVDNTGVSLDNTSYPTTTIYIWRLGQTLTPLLARIATYGLTLGNLQPSQCSYPRMNRLILSRGKFGSKSSRRGG